MAKRYWLMKSEPHEFSIDDLAKVGTEPWSGVRNYQVRNSMRDDMHVGDGVLFYHSSCAEPGVVGVAEIASAARTDPTQFDRASDYHDAGSPRDAPRWLLVDVRFKRKLKRTVTLAELKASDALADFALVQRGNRLSVLPVTRAQWDYILGLKKRSP